MNKIVLIFILIFSIQCKSQNNVIDLKDRCNHSPLNRNDGNLYTKDISNIYDPFIGVWKWISGNREMTLTLIKQNKYQYQSGITNYYEDRLVGYYVYKENGITLIDTSGDNLMQNYVRVLFGIYCNGTVGSDVFEDVKKEKNFSVKLETLSPTQMKFTGKVGEGTYHIGRTLTNVYLGSTFPLEMVFTKQ
ncbi:DUF6705 family protein [Chryseobacterium taiwanense]|uniref:DUF6705 domain-containing protein n=1 Tax=Chryseobacterium taiwanense TaxID=363331 RepID=A0A0B4D5Y1_9FLAO|nr:DUF6705 family protein [Chryseobacterium taiwanense]KIC62121.1 hypothetical protein RM51_13750 [Chryseobacterium taiwanense]